MCGRYASSRKPEDLVEEFEVDRVDLRERWQPDWNVAPTKDVPAVLERRDRDTGAVRRRLTLLRWGLVPSWAETVKIGSRLINARVETAAQKPAFRKAFAARRCLLPADGYYEWYVAADGPRERGRPVKQPFFICRADGATLAMAGLFELWRDPTRDADDPDAWLRTATVLTTSATDELGRLHDRMPLLVDRDGWDDWLAPGVTDPEQVRGLLVAAAPGLLEAYPVSRRVNDVRSSGPELVEPLPPEDSPPDPPEGAVLR